MNKSLSLDELLDEISVLSPGQWDNEDGPKDWYAVCTEKGIVAYFGKEIHALNFRLQLINQKLNPLK